MSRKRRSDFAVGGSQRVNVLDRNQRMFIDRIAVVIVANDQGIDRLKLRKQQDQHAQPVHGAQRGAGMRRHQDPPEVRPYLRRIMRPFPEAGQGRLDATLSFSSQLQAMAADEFEKTEKYGGVLYRRELAQKDAAFHHGEIGVRQARLAIFEEPVQTGASRRHFIEEDGQSVNRSNVAEVGSHPDGSRDRGWSGSPIPAAAASD